MHAGGDAQALNAVLAARGTRPGAAWAVAALLLASFVSGCATARALDARTESSAAHVQEPRPDATSERAPLSERYAGPQAGELAPGLAHLTWYRGAAPEPGQPYVLYFWGTWCKPCKAALPALMLHCSKSDLPIVAVSRDTPEQLDAFFAAWKQPFPARVAVESHPYTVHEAYEAWTLPRAVFVGPDGRVERVVYGPKDLEAL